MLERVYCDESGQDGSNRFMLIGGIWVPHETRLELKNQFKKFRSTHTTTNEMKWTRVTKGSLERYKRFVDIFFNIKPIRYNCILVDSHKLDYKTYHDGDRELGFYKFYYQLLSRKIESNKTYKIFVDKRQNRNPNRLDTLKRVCNIYGLDERGCSLSPIQEDILPVDSKKFDEIQLADIISGALRANYENVIKSEAKWELIHYIAESLSSKYNYYLTKTKEPLSDLCIATSPYTKKFNVWKWRPKIKMRLGSYSIK